MLIVEILNISHDVGMNLFFCYDYKEKTVIMWEKNIIGLTHLYFLVAYILQEIKTAFDGTFP